MLAHDAERFAEVGHANIFAVTSDEKCTHPYVFYLTDANGNYTSIEIVKGQEIYIADNGNALRIYQDDELSISLNSELTQHLESQVSNDKEKPLLERERKTYQNIIVALLDCINGKLAQIEKHPSFASEADMIATIEKYFKGYQGLSKTTLERKFADAKKSFKEQLK